MLPDGRRRVAVRDRRVRELQRIADQIDRALARNGMRQRDPHAPRRHLRACEHAGQIVDRSRWHAQTLHCGKPVAASPPPGKVVQHRDQAVAVRHAGTVGGEIGIVRDFGRPGFLAEAAELRIVADREDEFAVGRGEGAIRHDGRMLVAPARRYDAVRKVRDTLVDEPGDLRVEKRHVDVLAAPRDVAGLKRGEDPHRRVHAAHHVGDPDAHLQGPSFCLAGQAHHAALALGEEVVSRAVRVRPGLAEPRDRAVHDARIDRRKRRIVEPAARKVAHLEILHHDVRDARDVADDRLPLRMRKIDRDRGFPPVR